MLLLCYTFLLYYEFLLHFMSYYIICCHYIIFLLYVTVFIIRYNCFIILYVFIIYFIFPNMLCFRSLKSRIGIPANGEEIQQCGNISKEFNPEEGDDINDFIDTVYVIW